MVRIRTDTINILLTVTEHGAGDRRQQECNTTRLVRQHAIVKNILKPRPVFTFDMISIVPRAKYVADTRTHTHARTRQALQFGML